MFIVSNVLCTVCVPCLSTLVRCVQFMFIFVLLRLCCVLSIVLHIVCFCIMCSLCVVYVCCGEPVLCTKNLLHMVCFCMCSFCVVLQAVLSLTCVSVVSLFCVLRIYYVQFVLCYNSSFFSKLRDVFFLCAKSSGVCVC